MTEHDDGLVTIREAATLTGVHIRTVRSWIRRYQLQVILFDGHAHVLESEVLRLERDLRHTGRGKARSR
ncbi:helix-turn-helix domain-containing protein [Segeticoccus rhizosphaerae]|uniref:helix-turn-helix domain-containing protein n=1 Tax=Segeticoccus rhizosphaerae TaxID=1104777 RepID=UPI0012651F2B|nr:helix-turn-helix domain-containing protein [Segeticoccus rhizosphaerae]